MKKLNKFDESRIETHPTGYNYVRVLPFEVFNWGGMCICNSCNKQVTNHKMNLCWSLTDTYCDECFERIQESWYNLPKEDIAQDLVLQEQMSLDWYKYHLDEEYRLELIKKNPSNMQYMSGNDLINFIDTLDLGDED